MDRLRSYLVGALLGAFIGAALGAQSNHRARRQAEAEVQRLEDCVRQLRGHQERRQGGEREFPR